MKRLLLISSLTLTSFIGALEKQTNAAHDAEFKAQQEAKERSAQANTCRDLVPQNDAIAHQKIPSQKTEQQKFEDACAILYTCTGHLGGKGLVQPLQKLVFDYLQEGLQHKYTLNGHTENISCLTTITDAQGKQLLASRCWDKTIRIWDPTNGALLHTLNGITGSMHCFATITNAQGKQLLASSSDKTICIWDPINGLLLRSLDGHTSPISCLATIADAQGKQLLASGSENGIIHIWDPVHGTLLRALNGHKWIETLTTITDAQGKQLLASAHTDRKIRIWDPTHGTLLYTLDGYTEGPSCFGTITDAQGKQLLVSGSNDDRTIRMWDPTHGTLLYTLDGHTKGISCFSTITDAQGKQLLVSGSRDQTIRIWGYGPGEFERAVQDQAVVDQNNFEKARTIVQRLPDSLQQLVADYAVNKESRS